MGPCRLQHFDGALKRKIAIDAHDELAFDTQRINSGLLRCGQTADDRLERNPAIRMRLRIERYFSVNHVVVFALLEIGQSKIVKILLRVHDLQPLVIQCEKHLILLNVERLTAGAFWHAQRRKAGVSELQVVASGETPLHLDRKRAFDVEMQFGLWQACYEFSVRDHVSAPLRSGCRQITFKRRRQSSHRNTFMCSLGKAPIVASQPA